ncbi:hypothetical protein EUTSA_v10025580mg [Eutrema salsugineum]|uniref:F-box domain-containing protein n=1 Tax=Eutrema salsugineum TaxID=72664 RepID=V4LRL6_EUTSA|nr:F-box/kelch-repeat protein At4g39560 [Eutrema salsugineum]ESQ53240.1 hypothetical protein EUTSA_v10025580mg [Eutrema salsugineum]
MSNSAAKEPPTKEETSPSLSSLPDAVAHSFLARVPRSDHKAISLVSKKYRSLVLSPELYKTRSLMGRREECLYVCLSSRPYSTPLWFILRRENVKTTEPAAELIPISSFPSQPQKFSSFVSLDCGIYVMGGFINDDRTSDVWFLDCRSNKWRQVSSMGVARAAAAAGVVSGKIYVFGGCEDTTSSKWAEVFDPKSQTWDTLVPMDDRNEGDNSIRETLVMEDKVYAVDIWNGCFYYWPSQGQWGRRKPETQSFYCDSFGNMFWRESEELEWKKVKGLESLRKFFPRSSVRTCALEKRVRKLSNFGNNIVVFWVGPWCDVWCAEISLERSQEEGEIWGTIEWSEAVTILDHVAV